jgi:hypothetical protein
MPLYEINSQYPGAYVEGIGVLAPGTVIDLPEKMTIKDSHGGEREITISPRCSWIPLDEAAKLLFAKYRRTPNPKNSSSKSASKSDDGAPAGFESKGVKLAQAAKRSSDQ